MLIVSIIALVISIVTLVSVGALIVGLSEVQDELGCVHEHVIGLELAEQDVKDLRKTVLMYAEESLAAERAKTSSVTKKNTVKTTPKKTSKK